MLQKLKVFVLFTFLVGLLAVGLPAVAQAAPVPGDPHVNQPYTPPASSTSNTSGNSSADGLTQTYVDPAVSSNKCTNANSCDLITQYVNPLINVLAAAVGVAVTVSLVIGGIQYGSSAGDPQKVAAAKGRIRNSLIALIAFIFLYALLNFLVPGGLV